jgi:hypothetical protein
MTMKATSHLLCVFLAPLSPPSSPPPPWLDQQLLFHRLGASSPVHQEAAPCHETSRRAAARDDLSPPKAAPRTGWRGQSTLGNGRGGEEAQWTRGKEGRSEGLSSHAGGNLNPTASQCARDGHGKWDPKGLLPLGTGAVAPHLPRLDAGPGPRTRLFGSLMGRRGGNRSGRVEGALASGGAGLGRLGGGIKLTCWRRRECATREEENHREPSQEPRRIPSRRLLYQKDATETGEI